MRAVTFTQMLRETLAAELARDSDVFLMGEDIGIYGGSFGVTRGLIDSFGPLRVRDTPITEAALAGIAVGAAAAGARPVLEIMFMDFITLCVDPLVNFAAKLRGIYGLSCPLTLRTPSGAGRGYGATHSQSLERLFTGIPGLAVAVPATAEDASALLQTAIRSADPTLFIEHKLLYPMKFTVPDALPDPLPFGQARIARPGRDLTLVAWSYMVHPALAAAETLSAEGISAEVIDLRTLAPLDAATLAASAMKTGRVLIVEEGSATGGCSGEIAFRISERAGEYLEKPVRRLAAPDSPIPASRALEAAMIPTAAAIAKAARQLIS